MANWITPKTDWTSSDYFNASDYNRMVGNLKYLHELAEEIFLAFDLEEMVEDKNYYSMIYASQFNAIENNLKKINDNTYSSDIGTKKTYRGNGRTPDYVEFNRIESAMVKFFSQLYGQLCILHHLEFNLGRQQFGKRTHYAHDEVIAYRCGWHLSKGKGVI